MKPTIEDLNLIWNTKTLSTWASLNFDKIIFPSNILGTESYLTIGKGNDMLHIEGYEAKKLHKGETIETIYFIRSEDIKKLPLLINKTTKKHSNKKVYNMITDAESVAITPKRMLSFRSLIDLSGIPYHTNPTHWTLYKIKRLYGRLGRQFYGRYVTKSAFGKDKFPESIRLLLNSMSNLSDPSRAKLFYNAYHNKDITINELGVPQGQLANEYFNIIMRIGDSTQILDNPKRATDGTCETIDVSKLSVSFTHNIPEYYLDKGKPCFEQIYPYNVINRYYYNEYKGFSQMKPFPSNITHEEIAIRHDTFIKDWIKSALWWEENMHRLPNKYNNISLINFKFHKSEERFKAHFQDFAKAVSYYAKDGIEYLELLKEDYNNHKKYGDKIKLILEDNDNDYSKGELI